MELTLKKPNLSCAFLHDSVGGLHSVYSVLRKRREAAAHTLSAVKSWELASFSHLPEQDHLNPWGWHQAKLTQELFHKRKLLPCAAAICAWIPSPNPSPQPWQSNLLWEGNGSKSGTSPFAGVPECWPPASIKLNFQCVSFCPHIKYLHLGRWTKRQVFA